MPPPTEKRKKPVIVQAKESPGVQTASASTFWQPVLGSFLVTCNILVRVYSGLFMIISDCDETFNYWEPLNLIFRGFGKQTWEYSPAYAIRSYAYLIPYYLFTSPMRDFDFLALAQFPPYYYFYAIRIVCLCGFSAFAEYQLYRSIKGNYSIYVANWYLFFSTFSPGMSHASVALLPSSFAMAWVTWGTALALSGITLNNDNSVVKSSIHAISCFLVAGFVGWPFALALGIPFGLFTVKARYQTVPLAKTVLSCCTVVVFVSAYLLSVDSFLYNRKLLFVPMNIVLYNVFALEGEGSEIFGTEPLIYYAKNLLLNFNMVVVFAYLGAIVNNFWSEKRLKTAFGVSLPLLIWTVVFGCQPHKEERFLYPIYPFICMSGAIFTSKVFETAQRKLELKGFTRVVLVLSMVSHAVVSLLRIVNLVENYSAPLTTTQVLHEDSLRHPSTHLKNVCVGREWYHFPTSFFLPDDYRLRFVQSGFDGLLPGDFEEGTTLKSAASTYPTGMNSKNQFSADKVGSFAECDYYIDNSLPVDAKTDEPSVISRVGGVFQVSPDWEVLRCNDIIRPDGDHSGIGKILYVPEMARPLVPYNVEHMDFCVLKRKAKAT